MQRACPRSSTKPYSNPIGHIRIGTQAYMQAYIQAYMRAHTETYTYAQCTNELRIDVFTARTCNETHTHTCASTHRHTIITINDIFTKHINTQGEIHYTMLTNAIHCSKTH